MKKSKLKLESLLVDKGNIIMESFNCELPCAVGTLVRNKNKVVSEFKYVDSVYSFSIYKDGLYVTLIEKVNSQDLKVGKPMSINYFIDNYIFLENQDINSYIKYR